MKYLPLFLLLSGCSLIKINEAQPLPKVRPEFIGVTEVVDDKELETRVRVSDIIEYFQRSDTKCVILVRSSDPIRTNSDCNDIDGVLRK